MLECAYMYMQLSSAKSVLFTRTHNQAVMLIIPLMVTTSCAHYIFPMKMIRAHVI